MVSTVAERWAAMRAIYETFGVGIDLLCQATGRSRAPVADRMRDEQWVAPDTARSSVLARMFAMLETQLGELEGHVNAGEGADEKSVRTLGTMARTWEKLNALEQLMDKELDERCRDLDAKHCDTNQVTAEPTNDAGLHALRLELERRIAALVERKSADGVSKDADALRTGDVER
ncbi:MAG: hypothetical protein AAGH82_09765 [Pseudomonadota bacterium]